MSFIKVVGALRKWCGTSYSGCEHPLRLASAVNSVTLATLNRQPPAQSHAPSAGPMRKQSHADIAICIALVVSAANIFRSNASKRLTIIKVTACCNHPRRPIQRSIGIRARIEPLWTAEIRSYQISPLLSKRATFSTASFWLNFNRNVDCRLCRCLLPCHTAAWDSWATYEHHRWTSSARRSSTLSANQPTHHQTTLFIFNGLANDEGDILRY